MPAGPSCRSRIGRGIFVSLLVAGCQGDAPPEADWLAVPSHFPRLPSPKDNELTRERAALGRELFFDKRLSRDESVSCASCHVQAHAFSDREPLSRGVYGRKGHRNAPGLMNLAWGRSFLWDGSAPSLESQVLVPLTNPAEMDMTLVEVQERLEKDARLSSMFADAYGEAPNDLSIARALASFLRTMVSGESAWDRFRRGDDSALGEPAKRGLATFEGDRARCFHCHVGFNFTSETYRNNGPDPNDPDIGRARFTQDELDRGKFKVPTLRNVAVSAPYMHDGSIATLPEVIETYARGGRGHPNTDPLIVPLALTQEEREELLAFLESLTDEEFLSDPRFQP